MVDRVRADEAGDFGLGKAGALPELVDLVSDFTVRDLFVEGLLALRGSLLDLSENLGGIGGECATFPGPDSTLAQAIKASALITKRFASLLTCSVVRLHEPSRIL